MRTRALLALFAGLCFCATVSAQVGLPPGKWWRMPNVVKRLSITAEQQSRLDKIFLSSAAELIDLKAEVDKKSLELRAQLEKTTLDRESIRQAADGVNMARADLFARELMMLVDMRAVLTDEQWTQLRRALEERTSERRERRPGTQPPPPRDRQ